MGYGAIDGTSLGFGGVGATISVLKLYEWGGFMYKVIMDSNNAVHI